MSVGRLDDIPPPVASDGKPYVLPNIFPGEVLLNFTGCSDALSPAERFGGALFSLTKQGVGEETFTVDFLDGIFLAGGHIEWEGGSAGSSVYMELTAEASTVIDPPGGAGTGDCNLVQVGQGANLIVPTAPGTGAKTLATAVPIPANDNETNAKNGFWEYSEPWLGKGTMSPGTPQGAKYNLLDFPVELAHFAKLHLLRDTGSRDLIAPAIKPKWILPEWKIKVVLNNADANKTLKLGWDLLVARRKSV